MSIFFLLCCVCVGYAWNQHHHQHHHRIFKVQHNRHQHQHPLSDDECGTNSEEITNNRRQILQFVPAAILLPVVGASGYPSPANAAMVGQQEENNKFINGASNNNNNNNNNKTKKSRTNGYEIQKTEEEWLSVLTTRQYEILRNGGTEPPYSSILENEYRTGIYTCAGCGTPLFDSSQKFHSGTGWPSFAKGIKDNVEIESVNIIQANLFGAELRCSTCGGHLGDVFNDGYLFVGTPASQTGQRYCIDGSALIFESTNTGDDVRVIGDTIPSRRQISISY